MEHERAVARTDVQNRGSVDETEGRRSFVKGFEDMYDGALGDVARGGLLDGVRLGHLRRESRTGGGGVEYSPSSAFSRTLFQAGTCVGVVQVVGLVDGLFDELGVACGEIGGVYGEAVVTGERRMRARVVRVKAVSGF